MIMDTNPESRIPVNCPEGIPLRILEPITPKHPTHPQNWPLMRRIWTTLMLAYFNLIATSMSSIFGSGQKQVVKELGVSMEVAILGTTLFLIGYIFGFLIISPLSERFGRKYPMLLMLAVSSLMALMPALGKNAVTVLIGRFFAGLFDVSPFAVLGGVIADCWNPQHRGVAMACAVSLNFSGPTFGPIVGGFIVNSHLGWRWLMWLIVIVGLGSSILGLLIFPETYPPTLTRKMARRMSKQLNARIVTTEDQKKLTARELVRLYLGHPIWLISTQPILFLLTIYQSFVYGLLFLFYQCFPIAFGEVRGWQGGVASLPLLGVIVGTFLGTGFVFIYNNVYFKAHAYTRDGIFDPESRLPLMIIGGVMIPIGLFWFAWTSKPHIPWPSQVVSSGLVGCGMYLLFIQCFSYIMDCYTPVANSAMGVNGAIRSIFGAIFPLFARPMFHKLGVDWAMTLLAFLSLALVPVPIAFFVYGARIREKGASHMPK